MKFIIIMIEGYQDPSVEEVNFSYFTDKGNGFDVEQQKVIGCLSVGSQLTFHEGTFEFTVKRLI